MRKIVEMQFGSHVYGTNLPSSDTDFKGLAIPSSRDIIMQRSFKTINESTGNNNSRNTKDDIDREIFSLHYFMKLLTEGQTVCLDMLFTPEKFYIQSPYKVDKLINLNHVWKELKENQDKLITKKMSAFAGYCQAQAAKYSLKGSNLSAYEEAMNWFSKIKGDFRVRDAHPEELLKVINLHQKELNGRDEPLAKIVEINNNKGVPEKYIQVGHKHKIPFNASCKIAYDMMKSQYDRYGERAKLAQSNEGIDWKALMHAVRVCNEAIEVCKTGFITFPRPEAALLLQIRKGELPYQQVAEMIENGLIELNEAKANSTLPENPDLKWIEDFIFEVYSREVSNA